MTLELAVSPSDLARLLRSPALAACRPGRARTTRAGIVWHDTAAGDLSARGLALSQGGNSEARTLWRLERLRPSGEGDWLPGCQVPILGEAASPDALGYDMPGPLQPVAAFHGRMRAYGLGPDGATLRVLEGTLRGVAQDRPACRLILCGEARAMAALVVRLGEVARLSVPRAGLAAEAWLAAGRPAEARHPGPPSVSAGMSVADALRMTTAHLADAILHWAALVPAADSPEPVHQMRVAIRRMRSALAVFRRVGQAPYDAPIGAPPAEVPWLDALDARLRALAVALGAARDWDVFLEGTGAEVALAFGQDRRITRMLAAAGRRRRGAYAELAQEFGGRSWARLELDLAMLPTAQPWLEDASPDRASRLHAPLPRFAAGAQSRRLKRVISPGKSVGHLSAEELHAVRKHAKRLRYAAELFAPLFPARQVRRYLARLADLQEVLGVVNDTAVAAALMGQLGGGADRAFASGVVQGFGAARQARAASRVDRAWSRLYRAAPFWE